MKFTITREQLQEGLGAVAAAIPAKTTLPVLANVLVEVTKQGLRLSGTDLDIAVTTTVPAEVDAEGAVTQSLLGDLHQDVRQDGQRGLRGDRRGHRAQAFLQLFSSDRELHPLRRLAQCGDCERRIYYQYLIELHSSSSRVRGNVGDWG